MTILDQTKNIDWRKQTRFCPAPLQKCVRDFWWYKIRRVLPWIFLEALSGLRHALAKLEIQVTGVFVYSHTRL